MSFQINTDHVVFESFEDEVVLINLENGNYYSLEKTAADIWKFLTKGMPVSWITRKIGQDYRISGEEVESTVHRFVEDLKSENLIVPAESTPPNRKDKDSPAFGETLPDEPSTSVGMEEKAVFEPPKLNRYTDMQNLLLLDPIHDVNESGWPKRNP